MQMRAFIWSIFKSAMSNITLILSRLQDNYFMTCHFYKIFVCFITIHLNILNSLCIYAYININWSLPILCKFRFLENRENYKQNLYIREFKNRWKGKMAISSFSRAIFLKKYANNLHFQTEIKRNLASRVFFQWK